MDHSTRTRGSALAIAIAAALASATAVAQTPQSGPNNPEELDQIVVTGTRVQDRSVLDTAAPVDVVSADVLQNVGVTELSQALSTALPSFNFPRPGLTDGTDTIRPATLRGLAPDQTLVLVNSKRRHAASLVNVNNSIGRGASSVDLNTIPTAMIRSVEVLRDGASAQYGSDAIAGVINVRLRENRDGGDVSLTYGARSTEYTVPVAPPPAGATWPSPAAVTLSPRDGETITASAWKGFALGDAGFVTVAAEYKDQERTERGGYDSRQQYLRPTPTTFDPRERTIDRFNAWYGEPELEQLSLFANGGYELGNGAKLYGWASFQDREALSAGFFRRPLQDTQTVPEIYPDGFLPKISPDVTDYSAAFGVDWKLGTWDMDTSLVYGRNEIEFTIKDTVNASIGPTSKTEFDAGGYDYDQLVFNFSGVRGYDVGWLHSPLNVAAGVEARREAYAITAGEPDSYRQGGRLVQPGNRQTVPGSQVFAGFQPKNEVDEDRTAVGAYVDLEANVTEKMLASVAVRAEDYSDFGSNFSGKLSLRYDFVESFALRGTVQNGFRAPSLQQQFFTATSTNFVGTPAVPVEVTTFPVNDPVAISLGAQPLDAEESLNYSVGAVFRFDRVSLTVDWYRIDIDDRIVLSENLGAGTSAADLAIRAYLRSQGFVGDVAGRFFVNGVDTTTEGVDVVMNAPFDGGGLGQFDLTLTAMFNDTEVTKVPTIDILTAINPGIVLFGYFNRKTFEEGQPESKYSAALNWKRDRIGATLRATRYGEVLSPATVAIGPDPNPADVRLTPKTLVDLEGRWDVTDNIRLALGAENVLDEYPDPNPASFNVNGTQTFSNLSPFGRSGRYVYGRVSFTF
jgi:iron complex outermembrane receptor protein